MRGAQNRLDDADRRHRQRPRQIARQIDHGGTFHAHRRLNLVARNDRARKGRNHFDRDIEIHQLAFNQPRGELEYLGTGALDNSVRRIEQGNRRQRRIGQIGEQVGLLFAFGALGLRNLGDRLFDANRRMVLNDAFELLDLFLTLDHRLLAHGAVALGVEFAFGEDEQPFDTAADPLGKTDPRQPGKHAERARNHRHQQQSAAGEAQHFRNAAGEQVADHATRAVWQHRLDGMQAQGFERAGGDEQNRKAGQRNRNSAAIEYAPGFNPAEQAHHAEYRKPDPPPGGQAEQPEQEIGHPGTGQPTLVGDNGTVPAEKIAGIARGTRCENQCQINGDAEGADPAGFTQQTRHPGGGRGTRLR